MAEQRVKPRILEMARVFLVIGVLAFGGQGGLLALLSRDLAAQRGWVDEAEIAEAFTYVQLLPGAVVVQVVAYLGYRLGGWRGAAVATTCFLLPSVLVMFLLAAVYRSVVNVSGVSAALLGLTSAVVGLIALATYKQARKTIKDRIGMGIAVVVCAVAVWKQLAEKAHVLGFAGQVAASVSFLLKHLNPALLVVTAGMIGVLREALRKDAAASGAPATDTERTTP